MQLKTDGTCNVLAFENTDTGNQYVWIFDREPESLAALERLLVKWGADEEFDLTMRQAALLSQRVRRAADEACGGC